MLAKLDADIIDKLRDNDIRHTEIFRRQIMPATGVVVIFAILASVYLNSHKKYDEYYQYASILIPFAMTLAQFAIVLPLRRRNYEVCASRRLLAVVCVLDKNSSFWMEARFRIYIAAKIERIAVAIDGIPLAYRGIASEVRRELLDASRGKAQAMRRLELQVMRPDPSTLPKLLDLLVDDLCLISKGRWYDLPEAPCDPRMPRFLIIIYFSGAVVTIGAIIAIVAFASKVGPAAPIITTILGAIALALLNKVGLPVDLLGKYADTSAGIESNKKS